MNRALTILGSVVALFVAGCAIAYVKLVRPWVRPPDEPAAAINARWAEVERLAATPMPRAGAATDAARPSLESTLARVDGDPALRDLSVAIRSNDGPPGGRVSLPEGAMAVVASLREWRRGEGELGMPRCSPDAAPLGALTVGRLALAAAEDAADDPSLDAALYLASRLRREGDLLFASAGVTLTRDALAFAARRPTARAAIARYPPSDGELFPVLAREAVCADQAARAASIDGATLSDLPSVAAGLIHVDRERLMLRTFQADRLLAVAPYRDDLTRVAHDLALPPVERLPKSFLVRRIATDESRFIERWARMVDDHKALLER